MVEELPPPDDAPQPRGLSPDKLAQLQKEIDALDQLAPTKQVVAPRTNDNQIATPESYGARRAAGNDEIAAELAPYVGDKILSMDEIVRYLQSPEANGAMEGLSGVRIYDVARSAQTHAKLASEYAREGDRTNANQQSYAATGNATLMMTEILGTLSRHGADFAADVTPESLARRLAELPVMPRRDPNQPETHR